MTEEEAVKYCRQVADELDKQTRESLGDLQVITMTHELAQYLSSSLRDVAETIKLMVHNLESFTQEHQ